MAITLTDLLNEVGLDGGSSQVQTKTASENPPSTKEIDDTLEALGLGSSDAVKTASEQISTGNGGEMSLLKIYEQVIGGEPAESATNTTEKVASEAGAAAPAESPADATEILGEVTGDFFTGAVNAFVEKVAGDLEAEAGAGHKPFESKPSAMGSSMGLSGNAHMPVNNPTGDNEKVHAMTGGQSPYSLKEKALAKAMLKRTKDYGAVGTFHE